MRVVPSLLYGIKTKIVSQHKLILSSNNLKSIKIVHDLSEQSNELRGLCKYVHDSHNRVHVGSGLAQVGKLYIYME